MLIALVAVVLLAPTFELFDQGRDMEQGNDFVLALLCLFVTTSLFLLCRGIIWFLFGTFDAGAISSIPATEPADRSTEATQSPPNLLLSIGNLRI